MSQLVQQWGIAPHRIAAMIQRYWYLLLSSWPRLLELIYWPALQIVTWGFLQNYISQNAIRLAIGVIPMTLLAMVFFDFNFYGIGLPLVAFFCNLIFTSWSIGIFVSGLVLRNGLGAESIVWTLMFGVMPLACVYYPVTVLPYWLQHVAWTLPPTYVFEGMRALLIDHVFRLDLMTEALAINAVLFMASFAVFLALLRSARRHGSLIQSGE